MGIDKETEPSSVWISFSSNKEYLDELKKNGKEHYSGDKEREKDFLILKDGHYFEPSEYYFDDSEEEIVISGELKSSRGNSYISINMPLSDTVMIDIINHSIKKLAKFKTVLEGLK